MPTPSPSSGLRIASLQTCQGQKVTDSKKLLDHVVTEHLCRGEGSFFSPSPRQQKLHDVYCDFGDDVIERRDATVPQCGPGSPRRPPHGRHRPWPAVVGWRPAGSRHNACLPPYCCRPPLKSWGRTAEAALLTARRAKARTCPELCRSNRCRLTVLALGIWERWSAEAATFVRLLARCRALSAPICAATLTCRRHIGRHSPVGCAPVLRRRTLFRSQLDVFAPPWYGQPPTPDRQPCGVNALCAHPFLQFFAVGCRSGFGFVQRDRAAVDVGKEM